MTTIRRRSRARGGWYLGLFFISVGATDKCRDKTRSVDPHPLLESQPPVFREATRQAAGQARTVDCWVVVERSHAPPTRTFDRRFLPIHRAPNPKSIGQSTINHFSPALFRSVINIAPPNHGEIHLTSFPVSIGNIRANLAGNSKYPNFRRETPDCTNKQCDEPNYHKESVFAHLILID